MLNLVANGPSGYNLTNSLRFRASASAYLSRTMSASGTTTTWSMWVKRGTLGTTQALVGFSYSGTTSFGMQFNSDNTLNLYNYSSGFTLNLTTTQVFRDPSAWYHLVFTIDTTQATAANRAKIYVNGNQVTAFGTATYPSQNSSLNIGTSTSVGIGVLGQQAVQYFDGYLTEFNLIDGQALTPSSFGSTNATTGVWQPAKYTGTYGTNGFYLNFNSIALTSGSNTGLGKDNSGNGNYWNTNNISVTAGSTYDAMTDVPTLTSATVANYSVLNPLTSLSGRTTLSAANLQVLGNSAVESGVDYGTIGVTNGKWYWENTVIAASGSYPNLGAARILYNPSNGKYLGSTETGGTGIFTNGAVYKEGSLLTTVTTYTTGDIIGIALDLDNLTCAFYKNNTLLYTTTGLTAGTYWAGIASYNSSSAAINFGQRPFSYTPPTGFVALNTFNLPSSTIVQGNKYMDATTYTGNLTGQSITNAAIFQPDLVWIKSRSAATDHKLTDSVRGVTKALISDTTGAETTDVTGMTAFNTNGFTLGASTTYNNTSATYVGWQWQAGQGSTSSNTNGSITSTVSVNATAGFSVVTYTGTGANATVGHGLGVAPKMVITKNRGATSDWAVWHTSLTSGAYYLLLDTTAAQASGTTYWNSTVPTSSVFSVGTATPTNVSTNTYVAYCWAEIAGFSKFGSYTGNGSTDGPFVYTGFRPKFVMIKSSSGVEQWDINDTSRDVYNAAQYYLAPNSSGAEGSVNPTMDILSNGFKIRYSAAPWNTSGGTYIYAAFAENPFKNANAR